MSLCRFSICRGCSVLLLQSSPPASPVIIALLYFIFVLLNVYSHSFYFFSLLLSSLSIKFSVLFSPFLLFLSIPAALLPSLSSLLPLLHPFNSLFKYFSSYPVKFATSSFFLDSSSRPIRLPLQICVFSHYFCCSSNRLHLLSSIHSTRPCKCQCIPECTVSHSTTTSHHQISEVYEVIA